MKPFVKIIIAAAALTAVIVAAVILYPIFGREAAKGDDVTSSADVTADVTDGAQTDAEAASSFTVYDGEGKPVILSDFLGKRPIVVNFWATWCPPCKSELPDFDSMYKKYSDEVEFMMVKENGYEFPVYYDTDFDAANVYSVYSIPVTLFIDSDGTIKDQHIGMLTSDQLKSGIKSILK